MKCPANSTCDTRSPLPPLSCISALSAASRSRLLRSMPTRVSISNLLYTVEVCSILNGGYAATNVLSASLASKPP